MIGLQYAQKVYCLCQAQGLLVWLVPRGDQNKEQVDGVSVPPKHDLLWFPEHAELRHRVAALIPYCGADPAQAKVKLLNSTGI